MRASGGLSKGLKGLGLGPEDDELEGPDLGLLAREGEKRSWNCRFGRELRR